VTSVRRTRTQALTRTRTCKTHAHTRTRAHECHCDIMTVVPGSLALSVEWPATMTDSAPLHFCQPQYSGAFTRLLRNELS
jgi:hypothetical protein